MSEDERKRKIRQLAELQIQHEKEEKLKQIMQVAEEATETKMRELEEKGKKTGKESEVHEKPFKIPADYGRRLKPEKKRPDHLTMQGEFSPDPLTHSSSTFRRLQEEIAEGRIKRMKRQSEKRR